MKTIYRLETPGGTGVFSVGIRDLGSKYFDNITLHPNPYNDLKLKDFWSTHPYSNWLCGFENLEQYNVWFGNRPEVLERIRGYGIQLVSFDVDEKNLKVGQTQVLFLREKAKNRIVLKEF